MTVARILARKGRNVATVHPETTLREAIRILADKHIGALVAVDSSGTMEGIVSERDVVRAIATHGAEALDDAVSRFMTKKVVSASGDDGVLDIAQKMTTGRFRHMPVLDGKRLVGIVSVGDAIKYRLEQMEAEQEALKDYIATA